MYLNKIIFFIKLIFLLANVTSQACENIRLDKEKQILRYVPNLLAS